MIVLKINVKKCIAGYFFYNANYIHETPKGGSLKLLYLDKFINIIWKLHWWRQYWMYWLLKYKGEPLFDKDSKDSSIQECLDCMTDKLRDYRTDLKRLKR